MKVVMWTTLSLYLWRLLSTTLQGREGRGVNLLRITTALSLVYCIFLSFFVSLADK